MSTPAHALSAAYLALILTHTPVGDTAYVLLALASASVWDLDHMYYVLKDRSIMKPGQLHKARSPLHELVGFFVIGLLSLAIGIFDRTGARIFALAAMIHLTQDVIMGISMPFAPYDTSEISLMKQNRNTKIIIDVCVIVVFGVLWLTYLRG